MRNYLPEGEPENNMESCCANDMAYLLQEETGIVYNLMPSPCTVPIPKKMEYFSIILFEEGTGYATVDDERYEIVKGKVIVVFPGQLVTCDLNVGTKAHQLMAKTVVYESISAATTVSRGQLKPISGFDVSEEVFDRLLYEFLEIKKITAEQGKGYAEISTNRFKTVYLILRSKCMEVRELDILEVDHPVILKFLDIIDESFMENRTVKFYADKLHIQANYLNILCQSFLKTSAKEAIKRRLIMEIKNLILKSDYSIKEICYRVGINDTSYFTSFFKKETGFLPRDFLKLRKNSPGRKS